MADYLLVYAAQLAGQTPQAPVLLAGAAGRHLRVVFLPGMGWLSAPSVAAAGGMIALTAYGGGAAS